MHIEIRNLTKVYARKVHALQGIDLDIPAGMYGLLGPNGAGKTTLMRLLAGILRPSSGQIWIGAHDLSREKERVEVKRILGYLPQELGLYPDLSAIEFLDYIGTLKGMIEPSRRKQRITELLETVGLTQVAKRKLQGFSGGMKRRVGIAQALLNNPQVLIVDEPTAGLDPSERIHFRNLLAELGGNRIVLLSTHIVEDIAQTCQRLAVMKSGRVIFQGTTSDLLGRVGGHVWNISTDGSQPKGDLTIVSTFNRGASTDYRVVGNVEERNRALPLEPSLEDGYTWLMREQQTRLPS